jgi:excisionase family DNA binding protein
MTETTSERYYSISQTAKKLGVAYHTIRRLIFERKLKASKVSSQWRIKSEDLDAYLESRTLVNINS